MRTAPDTFFHTTMNITTCCKGQGGTDVYCHPPSHQITGFAASFFQLHQSWTWWHGSKTCRTIYYVQVCFDQSFCTSRRNRPRHSVIIIFPNTRLSDCVMTWSIFENVSSYTQSYTQCIMNNNEIYLLLFIIMNDGFISIFQVSTLRA